MKWDEYTKNNEWNESVRIARNAVDAAVPYDEKAIMEKYGFDDEQAANCHGIVHGNFMNAVQYLNDNGMTAVIVVRERGRFEHRYAIRSQHDYERFLYENFPCDKICGLLDEPLTGMAYSFLEEKNDRRIRIEVLKRKPTV